MIVPGVVKKIDTAADGLVDYAFGGREILGRTQVVTANAKGRNLETRLAELSHGNASIGLGQRNIGSGEYGTADKSPSRNIVRHHCYPGFFNLGKTRYQCFENSPFP